MTRERKIDIIIEELDHEITIATYQEKWVRKCLAAAFTRIESETTAVGGEEPSPLSVMNIDIQAAGKDSNTVLKELFGFYTTDIRYREPDQGLPDSKAVDRLQLLIGKQMVRASQVEAEDLLINIMEDYEQQGFINGFRYATAIWKAC